jgi:hypothetical protein
LRAAIDRNLLAWEWLPVLAASRVGQDGRAFPVVIHVEVRVLQIEALVYVAIQRERRIDLVHVRAGREHKNRQPNNEPEYQYELHFHLHRFITVSLSA